MADQKWQQVRFADDLRRLHHRQWREGRIIRDLEPGDIQHDAPSEAGGNVLYLDGRPSTALSLPST